jgi:hypothetical protein
MAEYMAARSKATGKGWGVCCGPAQENRANRCQFRFCDREVDAVSFPPPYRSLPDPEPRAEQPEMSLHGSLRTIRRQLMGFTATNRVVSIGGVGSSSLVAHLEDGDKDRIWCHSRNKHCLEPELLPEVRKGLEVKACFIYGDPFPSVLSVFRRGLQQRHEKSMSRSIRGYKPMLRKDTTTLEYLQAGVDRFFLGRQLENWVEYSGTRVKIMAVKYEALQEHIQDILDFLECDRPYEVRPRTSRYDDQPPEIQAGLEKMYGELKARIEAFPSLIRINSD